MARSLLSPLPNERAARTLPASWHSQSLRIGESYRSIVMTIPIVVALTTNVASMATGPTPWHEPETACTLVPQITRASAPRPSGSKVREKAMKKRAQKPPHPSAPPLCDAPPEWSTNMPRDAKTTPCPTYPGITANWSTLPPKISDPRHTLAKCAAHMTPPSYALWFPQMNDSNMPPVSPSSPPIDTGDESAAAAAARVVLHSLQRRAPRRGREHRRRRRSGGAGRRRQR